MKKFFKIFCALSIALCIALFSPSCMYAPDFGNAVWESDDPYFYWHNNITLVNEIFIENPDYVIPRDADEEEILQLYGKMKINGEIQFIEFLLLQWDWNVYCFEIYIFRTGAHYLSGTYTYKKAKNQTYDYEVYMKVEHAYDITDCYAPEGYHVQGDEVDLPFESFTVYVTLDR